MTDIEVDIPYWGERTAIVRKRLAYAFSLDVKYDFLTELQPVSRTVLVAVDTPDPNVYHVQDERFAVDAHGQLREVPRARIAHGWDWIYLATDGSLCLDARLLLATDVVLPTRKRSTISVTYSGVVNLGLDVRNLVPPGPKEAPPPQDGKQYRGTAFIASQHDTESARYRWLIQNQLIGIGKAEARQGTRRPVAGKGRENIDMAGASEPVWQLDLTFDMYSPA